MIDFPRFRIAALLLALALPATAVDVVPAELPKPADTPPATDQPVRIYILSGQSNSLGFGRAEGGSAVYPSIYLSPDPTIKPTAMPVGSSALLPMRVYRAENGEQTGATAWVYQGPYDPETVFFMEEKAFDLGNTTATVPAMAGPHFVRAKAFVEVPMTGMHEVHVGHGDSSYALATIDGQEVYRRDIGQDAKIKRIKLEKGKRHPVEITYFKGGDATFWMELVDLKPKGSLRYHIEEDGRFTCLVDDKGEWKPRNDVFFCDAYMGKGRNGPLSAMWRNGSFGPELGFGYVMGTFHDEPVIVMKADIGNRSLAWDCLPPGSERYEVDGRIYAGYKDTQSSWPKEQGEPKPGGWYAGKQYDDYTEAIHTALNNFDELFPQFKDQGYEIAGFVWWQGHKDQNPVHASRYEQNLVNLIKAWRKEFNAPDAKFAIATIAFGGWDLSGPGKTIAEAQLAVGSGKYPEFNGNVKTIEARPFWRDIGESPKSQGYHYNHNGETYFLVGDALGRAMVEMEGGKAEKRQLPPRPKKPESWPANPTLEQAVQMVYSDAFISPWSRDPAEPTTEDMARMAPALKPIVMDKLIPEYIDEVAKGVPRYRRHGLPLVSILTGDKPKDKNAHPETGLTTQLDRLISYYNAVGVHDYDWKPFTPKMQTATWHYYSFDPKDNWEKAGRYRDVKFPEGMANWYAVDFDPNKAGWKTGAAPFGQKDGELKALRSNCNNPQCRCDVKPKTLWNKEVLLMRQTFEIPPLKDDHRYRLVVGGGSHKWAGEGYAVYVNGKLFSELTSAFYKNGGERGANIYNDFRPDFASGKMTIAVKGFLRRSGHRGKFAPPSGQISVWLEQVKLPPVVDRLTAEKMRE